MSKKISTLGKVWLVFLAVISGVGVVSNLMAASNGVLYVVSAIACAGQLFGLFYLLQGKGINYLYVYSGCYLVNGILELILQSDKSVSFIFSSIFISFALSSLLSSFLRDLNILSLWTTTYFCSFKREK